MSPSFRMHRLPEPKPPALRLLSEEGFSNEDVLDRLADILFETDDLLEVLRSGEARSLSWIMPTLQGVFDEVNSLMKKLSD